MSEQIEFAVGTLRGVRAWNADALGRLTSISNSYIWRPGENVADCKRSLCDGIGDNCQCGFWAYYADPQHSGEVYGVIEAYGKTTQGTKGFRAEKARIVALTIPNHQPKQLSRWDRFSYWMSWGPLNSLKTVITIFLFVVGFAITLASLAVSPWSLLLTVPVTLGGAIGTIATFHGINVSPPKKPAPLAPKLDLVRRNYPDVRFYDSKKQMLKHEKLSGPELPPPPSPDDEDFWTRPAAEPRGDFSSSLGSRYSSYGGLSVKTPSVHWSYDLNAFRDEIKKTRKQIRKQIEDS